MDCIAVVGRLLCAALLIVAAPPSSAQSGADFAGEWVNVDASTGGIVKLRISAAPGVVAVRAFGACRPEPCDWGSAWGFVYGRTVSDSAAFAWTAVWKKGHAETTMTGFRKGDLLEVSTFTRFVDGSRRSNYVVTESFRRAPVEAEAPPRLAEVPPRFTVPPAESAEGVFTLGPGIVPPVATDRPAPSYTDEARAAKVSGTVLLDVVIRKDGTVGSARVIRGLGYGLDESAIDTITRRWRFKPGTRNGEPVDVQVKVEVSFRVSPR